MALTSKASRFFNQAVILPFTLSVAASRVVLGLHYPTDVAAGALIGGLMGYASARYLLTDMLLLLPG